MSATTCPSRQELFDYLVGKLPDDVSEKVAEHLESCPECQAGLATFDEAEDTLVASLRLPGQSDPYLSESACDVAMGRARAVAGCPAAAAVEPTGATPSGSPPCGTLGEYRLEAELGRGGMGAVYKAVHTKLDRVVALKVLPKGRGDDERAIARFEREMKAIGRLDHPNIVRAYDAREIDGSPVLIMEYVEGFDLGKLVHRLGRLGISDACELARRAAEGLDCAHRHGLVHRDVKPSNLMLSCEGELKLLDLGLARFQPGQPAGEEMTGTGQAMGTADYMAPEQASDSHAVDIRADIYSLGCTLYRLLSGHAPFSGPQYRSNFERMTAHVRQPVPPIRQSVPELPEELAAVLDRMLAKDPRERPASPAELAESLRPFCGGCDLAGLALRAAEAERAASARPPCPALPGEGSSAAPGSGPAPLPFRHRWRFLAAAVGLMLLSLGAGIALGITITIHRNGAATSFEVADGSRVKVDKDGNVAVIPPSCECEVTCRRCHDDEGGNLAAIAPGVGRKPTARTAAKSDLEAMRGTWELELMVDRGRQVPKDEDDFRGMQIVIAGDRFIILRGEKLFREYRLKLDASTSPKTMDWLAPTPPEGEAGGDRVTERAVLIRGIYELQAQRLQIAQEKGDSGRPERLPTEPYSPEDMLTVLKRVGPVPAQLPRPPRPGSPAYPGPPGEARDRGGAKTPGGAEATPSRTDARDGSGGPQPLTVPIEIDRKGEVRVDASWFRRLVADWPSEADQRSEMRVDGDFQAGGLEQWLTQLRERVDGAPELRVELRCDPEVSYKEVAVLVEAIKRAGVKDVWMQVAEAPVRAGRLDFRIAPTRGPTPAEPGGSDVPRIQEPGIERYRDVLRTHGPQSSRKGAGSFAWFELIGDADPELITAAYRGRQYVLLATAPEHVMLAEEDGKRAWGLEAVHLEKDTQGHPAIGMDFDEAGQKRLASLTESHLNQRLAMLLDDRVVCAPKIRTKLSRRALIVGRFDDEEIQQMLHALQAGMITDDDAPAAQPEKTDEVPGPGLDRQGAAIR